jgi:outer membrane receptor protein involved in Fe transport
MKTFQLLSVTALAGTLATAPAFAQTTSATAAATSPAPQDTVQVETTEAEDDQAIVVTGSRIRRPNLESTVPITSISGESLLDQGNNNIGDTLNELPQLRSTRAQSNPSTGIGIAGLNLLDLRGLGTNRTLVLVNGRRHVAGDIASNAQSPDINTIPNDLIERVDIVTGGNSAIYGSDAIAGVVNFILRRNFDGLQVRGQTGISTPGAWSGNQYVSAMAGKNFGDGRGNITLHGEYARQDRVFTSDVPYLRTVEGLGIVDSDPGGTLNGSDGNPDSVYFRNITNRNGSRYGTVFISQPNANPACGLGVGGTAYNCLLVFDQAGNLSPSTETARFSTGPIGGAVGGNLDNGREDQFSSILPQQDRYNANLLAHYRFSDALEAFVEAKYVRVDTQGSNSGAGGIGGGFVSFDRRERIRLDNPFLTPAQRATIAAATLASGCVSVLSTACSTTTANSGPLVVATGDNARDLRPSVADGSYRFSLGRTEVAGGIRDERFRRETYRIVGGLRGTFNEDWNYELSANFGRMNEFTRTQGFVDNQRLALSLDAGRNPVTGQIQCRAQFDPASAVAYDTGAFQTGGSTRANAGQAARLAADIAACVPFNPFGGTADNTAARNYFNVNTTNEAWSEQFVVSGFVGGDTSGFFNLPGGPVRFAVGAEYRREDVYFKQDDFAGTAGNTNNVVLGLYLDPPAFEVKEAFGELQLPILTEAPFFHDLTVSAAGRAAQYQGGVGTVYAYNVGVEWAPVRDIRFRGNYSRAIRAPYVTETSGSQTPNFSPGFGDPCNPANIGTGTQFRAANCAADLGALLANITSRTYGLPVISGSNPNLEAETSDSYTVGVVIQPRWVPGLALTVDYYDITVNDIIASPTAQQIANSCYDQPTLDNVFCQSFQRFRGPGVGPFNEVPGEITGNTLLQVPLNYARRVRRGIDAQLAYRTTITDNVRLNTNLIYTHNFQISNFENPGDPTFENRILSELGDPQDEFRLDTDIGVGPFTFGYRMRYIGPMTVGFWENYNSLGGRAPQNLDAADITEYPATYYHDLRFEWDVRGDEAGSRNIGRDLNFFVGVDNVLGTVPPLGATGAGAGGGGGAGDRPGSANSTGAIYEVRGRQFYAGFKARF